MVPAVAEGIWIFKYPGTDGCSDMLISTVSLLIDLNCTCAVWRWQKYDPES